MRATTAASPVSPQSLESGDLAGSEGIELSTFHNPTISSRHNEAVPNAPVAVSSSISSVRQHESAEIEQSDSAHLQSTSGFERLPPEVRNRIYHYATPTEMFIWPYTYKPASRARSLKDCHRVYYTPACALQADSVPSILQICQMTRKEAYPLYLTDNVFVLHLGPESYLETLTWLQAMHPDYMSCLKRIIVQGIVPQWQAHSSHNNHFAVTLNIETSLLETLVEIRGDQRLIHPSTKKIDRAWARFAKLSGRGDTTPIEQKEAFIATVKDVHRLLKRARWQYRFNKTFSIKWVSRLTLRRVLGLIILTVASILFLVGMEEFVIRPSLRAHGLD
ncbi:hypothetical protein LTR91_025613 [Friedmanniomyces endolithicus]|uniref:2EXR domain-containing protein n=2 Tax=Dothideomycetidae TaxID=451867 RepID=A0AAN6GYY5_9PEZI|nr:hypothetical protein LTR94_010849 [Friedmanniomyces endolithicus]KAK5142462.1 hypothetical protein LTR32_005194 [Rachicladosporium monterosium]KAK0812105.1 hypothetical protein LTR59_001581 [Friedmanniomyces endolithicus]KAK0819314.1 hypothetical protein LTR38_000757 [Friedmanniomyces endolithicus]KAK0821836.1 hypothetical protein LTR75_000493 [Friedmanniomyces endolithicus]